MPEQAGRNPVPDLLAGALARHGRGDLAGAEAMYREVLAREPEHPDALHLLGVLAHQVGQHGIAVDLIGQASRLRPQEPVYRNSIGQALLAQNRLEDAAGAFGAALQLRADDAASSLGLGVTRRRQQRAADAAANLERAAALAPGSPEAQLHLGHLALEAGDLQQARARYTRALDLQPGFADACAGLAAVLEKDGHRDAAMDQWRHVLSLDQRHAGAQDRLAALLAGADTACWCGGTLQAGMHPLYGDCGMCGTQVLRDRPKPESRHRLYADGYWRDYVVRAEGQPPLEARARSDFGDRIPVWHDMLVRHRPAPAAVLEIGCAHGGFLHYCRERGVPAVVGVDADAQACAFARERFGLPHVLHGFFPDVELPLVRFDAIAAFDVLQHLPDPLQALQAMARLLTDEGVFLLQTPCYRREGRRWAPFKPREHVHLFSAGSLRRACTAAGLEIIEMLPGLLPEDMTVIGRRARAPAPEVRGPVAPVVVHGATVERILWMRPDSIGDNVLAASMLAPLRARYPAARIGVVCQSHIADLYLHCPFIDETIPFSKTRLLGDEVYRDQTLRQLAQWKPDLALNAVYSRDGVADVLTLGSAPRVAIAHEGDACNLPPELMRRHNPLYGRLLASPGAQRGELERHADFLRGLGIEPPPLGPVVWLGAEDELAAEAILANGGWAAERTLVLFAGAQFAVRIYEHYAAALAAPCREFGLNVLAIGAENERAFGAEILAGIGAPGANLCGRLRLREAAALLRRCRLAVGAETGNAHLACAVGTPNVVLIGGGHYGRFMPYSPLTTLAALPLTCYGCNWECRYPSPHCVKDVEPAVIAAAVRAALAGPAARPRLFVPPASRWRRAPDYPAWTDPSRLAAAANVEVVTVAAAASPV